MLTSNLIQEVGVKVMALFSFQRFPQKKNSKHETVLHEFPATHYLPLNMLRASD